MTSSSIFTSLRLTTSAPKCAALAWVTSAGRTSLLASMQIHHAHAGGLGFLPQLGHLVGGHEAQVHQHVY